MHCVTSGRLVYYNLKINVLFNSQIWCTFLLSWIPVTHTGGTGFSGVQKFQPMAFIHGFLKPVTIPTPVPIYGKHVETSVFLGSLFHV